MFRRRVWEERVGLIGALPSPTRYIVLRKRGVIKIINIG